MNKTTHALEDFSSGYVCSQSVLGAFCEELGLDKATAMKLALGFGGGFARCGETCGAVTGALMVIGLKKGSACEGESAEKRATYRTVAAFIEAFERRHGSIACHDLLGCDIGTPEGHRRAEEAKLFETLCPKLVGDAVAILETLLAEAEPPKR